MAIDKYSVCIYPNISKTRLGSNNPYIEQLKTALNQQGLDVDPSSSRNAFTDFLKKGIFSDMVVLNWIEDLPSRQMGLLQSIVLMAYIPLIKIRGAKVVWIKHNRVSHAQKWFRVRRMIQQLLGWFADHIIVHARDGETAGSKKTRFIPHPCNISPDGILLPGTEEVPAIDFLIWGSILPYKGVLEFLQYVENNSFFNTLTIYVVGKCEPGYWSQLAPHAGKNIHIVNKFIEEDELKRLFKRTRFILFTYNKSSVLSSGVLVDSLVACKKIIAPDCGAFRDMAEQTPFVSLFPELSGIEDIYRLNVNNFKLDYTRVREFVAQNSWYKMGGMIRELSSTTPDD
jgi:beta-1,4-mannosyltransferase